MSLHGHWLCSATGASCNLSYDTSCHLVHAASIHAVLYTTRHHALHVVLPAVYILLFELVGITPQQASNGDGLLLVGGETEDKAPIEVQH